MTFAYFDTIGGLSGDMTLGAFVSAGVPLDHLSETLRKLGLGGYELTATHIERSGIVATKVDVIVSEDQHHHRHLKDIVAIIDNSALSKGVKENAKAIFREVAIGEAKVHDSTIERVHFHEVGALDSIVDIVGTAVCLEYLNIEQVYSSPIKLGNGGQVNTQHGIMPVPTPATIEILKGYPTILTSIKAELTTPTGAAIIKALSKGLLSTERMRIDRIGYGAGTREIEEVPNLLRIMIGKLDADYNFDEIVSVETNIDDMNPEIYPYVLEKLMEAGAHDAYLVPILMKKGRPGMLLSVLLERSKLDPILSILFLETTTLGVRIQTIERRKVSRSSRQVQTSLGTVTVKVIRKDTTEYLV
ncbi:MAG: nickel pincer cofactor biosynthesis protein LarC, partial [Bacteroidota bacterium]